MTTNREDIDKEILREFLLETTENLARMDQEMVQLERMPADQNLLASVFRTIHTIKGTSGFFGFSRLEAVAHATEHILDELRHGERQLDTSLATLILASTDALKRFIACVEAGEGEGPVFEEALLEQLRSSRLSGSAAQLASAAEDSPASPARLVEDHSAPPSTQANLTTAEPAGKSPGPPERLAQVQETADRVPAADVGEHTRSGLLADTTLRIGVQVLDRIMNLVSELVLTRNQLLQYNAAQDDSSQQDNALTNISQRLDLIASELQERVMKTRMQPVSTVWNKLPRVVRDLAAALNKNILLDMQGAETELDRTLIEAIRDPLTHIVRNSCDHGIETPEVRLQKGKPAQGRLNIRAFHESGNVHIEIIDDGAGIDPLRVRQAAIQKGIITPVQAQALSDREAVNLVLLPGFSTATQVTNISGRGVGMDVVKTNIERVGGSIDLSSRAEQGTTVRINLPLTLAIMPGLIVKAAGERFVIPQVNLHELIWLDAEGARSQIEHIHGVSVLRQRDGLLPLADLSVILQVAGKRDAAEFHIAVVHANGERFGLIVDSINDTYEVVVKPLSPVFKGLNCYSGATIMGDGGIALILDIQGIGIRAGLIKTAHQSALIATGRGSTSSHLEKPVSMLLFRSGNFQRLVLPLSQVARLECVPRAQVERAGGKDVLQYGATILPLVSPSAILGNGKTVNAEILQVVVCQHQSGLIGLTVDEVIDAVEEAMGKIHEGVKPGLLGSTVVDGRVTDILDLDFIVAQHSRGLDNAMRSPLYTNAEAGRELIEEVRK